MNAIIPPLKPDEKGAAVANLQDALLALLERKIIQAFDAPNRPTLDELQKLTEGLNRERDQSQFGKATQQLIMYFQVQQGLGDNLRGVVEDKTAAKLNELLKSFGALDDDTSLIVRGTVKNADDQPVSGATVRAFDRDLRKLQPLGDVAETNDLGEYIIPYNVAQFASGDVLSAPFPKLVIQAFVGDKQIGDDVSRPHPSREEVVDFKTSTPVVSEWEQLSTGVSPLLAGQGKDDQALPPWEVNDGDLDFIAAETGLDRGKIRLWALAFVVGREAAASLQPAAGPAAPVLRIPTTGPFNPAGTDRLSAFAIFYGWFRLDLPLEPNALWATSTENLIAALNTAIEQGIVPATLGEDPASVRALIEQMKADRLLQAPALGTAARLGDLLAISPIPLSLDQRRTLATAMADLRPDDPQLAKQIAGIPGFDRDDVAVGVARTLRLGTLTGGHPPLAQALQLRLQQAKESEGSLRPLAVLRSDEWLDLAYTHGTPAGTTITPVAYADALADNVERQHPTAALAAHFADGRRLARHPALTDVRTFLQKTTDFDIATANLNAVGDQAKLAGIPESQHVQLVDGLHALQRMNGLGASWDETAALLENDLYSPHQLLASGPTQLAARLDGRIAPDRVTALYRQAEDLHSTTLAAFTAGFSPLSAPRIMPAIKFDLPFTGVDGVGGGIPHTADPTGTFTLVDLAGAVSHHLANRETALDPGRGRVVPPPRTGIVIPDKTPPLNLGPFIDHQPTLQALFGSQDGCACKHCDSVLGPAAYFVDVMEFIRNGEVLDDLLARRPDLQDVELSCNNTNTEVPAIDLALEILENAVALELPVELGSNIKIEDQLKDGLPVGDAVRAALKLTVQNLADEVEVRATRDGKRGNSWTVVDGHRRWKLTAQPEGMLMAGTRPLNTRDVSALIAALDNGQVAREAEEAFAGLFAANQTPPPDFANYAVTITPLVAGKSWRVEYQFVGQLVTIAAIDAQIVLQTATGEPWWNQTYSQATLTAVKAELAKTTVPELVQRLVASRFATAPALTVTPVSANTVAIASAKSVLTLNFTPAQLTIVSLAYQSGDPDADPIAWPENHNPAAYEKLKGDKVVFPWSLPVDLSLEEVRLFLERARSSRRSLIELMQPVARTLSDDAVFAREVLGLSKAEATLIATEKTDPAVFACWGVAAGQMRIWDAAAGGFLTGTTTLSLLQNVSILLQQSRLSFEELQAVLATLFVQDRAGPLVIKPDNTCKPSEMTVALTPGHLDRIHRFVRLQRRLGWSAQDLDTAIRISTGTPPSGALNDTTLLKLADLARLCELLDLPVTAILAWWNGPATLTDQIRLLAPAIGLTGSELEHASLLLGVANPLANPGDTLRFCERIKDFQRSDLAFEDLRYLLRPEKIPGSKTGWDANQLTNLVEAVDAAVRSIPDALKKTPPVVPAGPESVEARAARENETLRITQENSALALATRVARENAAIAAIATALGAARELVDELLRVRLRSPIDPNKAAIDVLLIPLGDVLDLSGLVGTLRTHSDPVSAYLWNAFSADDRLALTNPASTAPEQQTTLVAALNQVLKGASIYEASRFAGVNLSRDTLALISGSPTGADLLRLNRLLLEDAFALVIAKRRSPDRSFVTGDVSQPLRAAVLSVLVRLQKTALLCDALKLSRTDLSLLRTSATDVYGFEAMDFNTLPATTADSAADIADFEQLLALAQLRGVGAGGGDLLQQYAALNFADGTAVPWTNVAAAHQILRTGLTLTQPQVEAAAQQLHITTAEQYRDPIALTRLIKLLAALKQLGATVAAVRPATLPSLTNPNGFVSASPNDRDADAARELLRAKYGAVQWHDLIKPIADKLRERQRDALVDYLIGRDAKPRDGDANPQIFTGPRRRDANDLYEYYLIDVQTASCLKTTRLLQATAAAQLFVQRLLLNLEDGLSLTEDKRALWAWMHNYRVWEANRKVFLYPENWLLPELRDDKTATFRQMESALTEKEASPENTRSALLGYLEELGDLAQITVVTMYEDRRLVGEAPNQTAASTLYVVGRTPNQPYRYFWRSCAQFGGRGMSWSGWEALDLDNANDFIMPFVMEGDLHVAWPIFRETRNETRLMWEVQIAWTRRSSQGWIKRKIGKAQLSDVERLPNKEASTSFAFRFGKQVLPIPGSAILKRERIDIGCYAATEVDVAAHTSLQPDPSLLQDTAPTGYLSVPPDQWNVNCEVKGVVYKYVTNDKEGDKFYQGWPGLRVDLKALRHDRDGTNSNISSLTPYRTTGAHGEFSFSFKTNVFGRNGATTDGTDWGIINGARIELTFNLPGGLPIVKTGNLVKSSTQGSEYYFYWTWEINVGVEDKGLANLFLADREVKYQAAGAFVFESGKDLRLDPAPNPPGLPAPWPLMHFSDNISTAFPLPMQIDGNRFLRATDHFYFQTSVPLSFQYIILDSDGIFLPTLKLNFPVFVARATQSPLPEGTPGPLSSAWHVQTWYIQDNDRGFYLQRHPDGWHFWPDGQPFASSYRTAATISNRLLFSTEVEADLIDPAQNNFLRPAPYANYNWELFLHAPLAMADHLANQQRFADARLWLHAVFDPTTEKKDKKTNQIPQFWRFLPFDNATQPIAIAKLLTWLADPNKIDPKDTQEIEENLRSWIDEWKKNPFMPHLIARLRPSAYQWHTFFAYLDVLIGWGDQLFRRDTRESVNDATLLYVLAAKLLGPRPRTIPAPTPPYALTYRLLQGDPNQLDSFSNAWVNYADLPGVKQLARAQSASPLSSQSFALQKTSDQPGDHIPLPLPDQSSAIPHLSSLSALAFCIPQNEKVTEFYDRVENRLFNIRHCQNIEGVFRDLPLYEPPFDPLLLIRARAAGLDLDSVLADLYAPLPHYRFNFTLQKALELCGELKALGGALLTTLEKQDAEELTLLRSGHEIAMLKLVRDTRQQQIAEAGANLAALQQSEATVLERFGQYQKLLGKPGVTKGQDGLPVVEQSSSLAVATDAVGGVSGLGLSHKEVDQLVLTAVANEFTQAANATNLIAGILSLFPDIWAGDALVAGQTFGGSNLGIGASLIAKAMEMGAVEASYFANQAGVFGGYERRQDEWVHQSKLALAELKQIQQQILAAEIRKQIAERELDNHDTQLENAREVEDFMRSKFTNQQLFRWMSSQTAGIYFRTYQLALDQARRTERACQHELGLDPATTPFVRAGNWDNLKRGLLAGEHLHHDLKRMESAYLERNLREFEITKHISLLQLDPGALIKLRQTSTCDFDLPEVLFDLDYPGHYLRRIKMVSLSIPCVVGPYASVNATLQLTRNEIRTKLAANPYRRRPEPDNDSRFMKTAATISTIVTSSAQQDSGMFEPNLRDERYLPFEGSGVISSWRLQLASEFRAFDSDTIADVVLHLRYTARDGGADLRQQCTAELAANVNAIKQASSELGLVRLFSLRHEFPTEWHRFLYPVETKAGQSLELELSPDRFPLLFRGRTIQISRMDLFLKFKESSLLDYQNSGPLTLELVPPGTAPTPIAVPPLLPPIPQFVSDVSILNGLPHAFKDFAKDFDKPRTLGRWSLTTKDADIERISALLRHRITASNGDHWRLKPELIDDIFMVCRYSI